MFKRPVDGRLIILLLFVVYASIFLSVLKFTDFKYTSAVMFNVPTMNPTFADLRVIQGAHHTVQEKGNPYLHNPYDPWKRTYNYPPIWIYILGPYLTPDNIYIAGVILIIGFLITSALFIGRIPVSEGFYYAVLIVSPVNFMLLERGNIDIFVFILTALYIYSFKFNRDSRIPYLLGIFISFISMLKLYPIFALSGLSRDKKTYLKILLVSVVVFLLYLLSIAYVLPLISHNTPRTYIRSYGCAIIPTIVDVAFMNTDLRAAVTSISPYVVGLILLVMMLGSVTFLGFRRERVEVDENSRALLAFRVGVGLFVGTFALGNNWDYRLVIMLFTVPQLLHWRKTRAFNGVLIYSMLAVVALKMNWLMISSEERYSTLIINGLMTWYLVGTLTYVYVRTLPVWLNIKNETITNSPAT